MLFSQSSSLETGKALSIDLDTYTDDPHGSFGRDQTCAMLLGLACGNTFMDTGDLSMPGTLCTVSPDVANIAKQAFYDFGERPIWTERVTYGTSKSLQLSSWAHV